jgi:HEAT repeat protein
MAIPTTQLGRLLASDEPDYEAIARLGAKILPQLLQLVAGRDEYVAANAASLAGMIDHDQAIAVLERGVRSRSAEVRTAAAGALSHFKRPKASGLIATLLGDSDKGVRKFAIKAAAMQSSPALIARVRGLGEKDPVASNRMLAKSVIGRKGTAIG